MQIVTRTILAGTSLLVTMFLVRRFSSSSSSSTFRPGILYTTESNTANAKKLARLLIQSKHAACVQLKEVTSIFEWEGKVEEEKEIQLTIKCNLAHFSTLESFIKSKHSYDVPQIIAVDAMAISSDYLSFLTAGTTQ